MRHAQEPRAARARAGVALVSEFLLAHAADHLTLEELAAVAGLSRYHVIRAFRARYGVTPFAYQRGLRVQRACEVLARGGTVAAAVAAGAFADQSHLGRMFLGIVGVTPGQYRARAGAEPGIEAEAHRNRTCRAAARAEHHRL